MDTSVKAIVRYGPDSGVNWSQVGGTINSYSKRGGYRLELRLGNLAASTKLIKAPKETPSHQQAQELTVKKVHIVCAVYNNKRGCMDSLLLSDLETSTCYCLYMGGCAAKYGDHVSWKPCVCMGIFCTTQNPVVNVNHSPRALWSHCRGNQMLV